MSRAVSERRLMDVAQRLRRAREELAVIEDQLAVLSDAADEARIVENLDGRKEAVHVDVQYIERTRDLVAGRDAACP